MATTSRHGVAHKHAVAATRAWYKEQGWTLFNFQRECHQAWHEGRSGLVHSPTGSGKTLAAWLGPVQDAVARLHTQEHADKPDSNASTALPGQGLEVLWITPLRALAQDTHHNLQHAADALAGENRLDVDLRTGDTSSSRRQRQRKRPPFALVTTPESLSVMLSHVDARLGLQQVHTVVVDEWHELMGSKRGVLLQLALARLRAMPRDAQRQLRLWGLSATLANLDEALAALIGPNQTGHLITGVKPRRVKVETLIPSETRGFPWAGHYGQRNAHLVAEALDRAGTTLVFTNTRAQAEIWFQTLLQLRPELSKDIALHHGSIDRDERLEIEERLRRGSIVAVVCTSSLDLGVDFSPVEQVIQIGSPKGVARLLQRAGRSGHRPGAVSRVLCMPTNALELVEITAARRALKAGQVEARQAPRLALDVLCQHLVTVAIGEGFDETDMRDEVRLTHCFANLSDTEWQWCMDFITRGGQALQGYPQYHKVMKVAGLWRVMNEQVAQRHRTHIGTITSDVQIAVALVGGKRLGHTPESFISRMKPGDCFQFAGKQLELVRMRDLVAIVRIARKPTSSVPRWSGSQMPLSSQLADAVLETLRDWKAGKEPAREMAAIADYLHLQARRSALPAPDEFLVEYTRTPDGYSLFFYPFAGRLAHEGLSMLAAQRLSAQQEITFTLQINDYGFELMSDTPMDVSEARLKPAFDTHNLAEDILASMNAGELTQRRFRDIARIAGLVFEGHPGRQKSARQIQASTSLIYEVLRDYDSNNLLLQQAQREVLEAQLDFNRLQSALERIAERRWRLVKTDRLTPLSFPLWAESVQTQTLSSESTQARIERMLGEIDEAASKLSGH